MDRPRFIRWLRVSVSVVCVMVFVGLLGLLVRSYWWADTVHNNGIALISAKGRIHLAYEQTPHTYRNWGVANESMSLWHFNHQAVLRAKPGFSSAPIGKGWPITIPAWLLVMPTWLPIILAGSVAIAAAPWIRWSRRFSLRTMFIVTTLVAVVLAFVVWMMK